MKNIINVTSNKDATLESFKSFITKDGKHAVTLYEDAQQAFLKAYSELHKIKDTKERVSVAKEAVKLALDNKMWRAKKTLQNRLDLPLTERHKKSIKESAKLDAESLNRGKRGAKKKVKAEAEAEAEAKAEAKAEAETPSTVLVTVQRSKDALKEHLTTEYGMQAGKLFQLAYDIGTSFSNDELKKINVGLVKIIKAHEVDNNENAKVKAQKKPKAKC